MRLLIVGTLKGQLTTATKLAMDKGATVTHADSVDQALAVLRSGRGADLIMADVALDIRDLVVRLGFAAGQPIALEKVQVVSTEPAPWITRAEATLCGPEADPWPLSLTLLPRSAEPAAPSARTIPPVMAVRHASDDLHVRWWAPR